MLFSVIVNCRICAITFNARCISMDSSMANSARLEFTSVSRVRSVIPAITKNNNTADDTVNGTDNAITARCANWQRCFDNADIYGRRRSQMCPAFKNRGRSSRGVRSVSSRIIGLMRFRFNLSLMESPEKCEFKETSFVCRLAWESTKNCDRLSSDRVARIRFYRNKKKTDFYSKSSSILGLLRHGECDR